MTTVDILKSLVLDFEADSDAQTPSDEGVVEMYSFPLFFLRTLVDEIKELESRCGES